MTHTANLHFLKMVLPPEVRKPVEQTTFSELAGKMFVHSVRVVSTALAAPICHMVIVFVVLPILPMIENFPIHPFLGGSLFRQPKLGKTKAGFIIGFPAARKDL